MEVKIRAKKTNYRKTSGPHGKAARKARRRVEAEARNAAYAALSLEQKIAQQEPYKGKQYRKLIAKQK